jgi:hypothetical protein
VADSLDPFASFRLDGRVALVTGASSGLGARFARVLDGAGATVVLAARRADRLRALAGELRDAYVVPSDLSDASAAEDVVGTTVEQCGRLDIVVNNAGIHEISPAVGEDLARFREIIDVNLVAPFVISRTAARHWIDAGDPGVVVNVASMLGVVGVGQVPMANYTATKGALVNLTRDLAAQWARKKIRVNALAPGWFATEMTAEMFADEQSMKWVATRAPMGRAGEEHELDGALLFLASDASSYVTGTVLLVDGGWTAV